MHNVFHNNTRCIALYVITFTKIICHTTTSISSPHTSCSPLFLTFLSFRMDKRWRGWITFCPSKTNINATIDLIQMSIVRVLQSILGSMFGRLSDTPPNSLYDSNANLKVKTSKEERMGICFLIRNTSGVKGRVGAPGWGLGWVTSGSIIRMDLYKPNNKLVNA